MEASGKYSKRSDYVRLVWSGCVHYSRWQDLLLLEHLTIQTKMGRKQVVLKSLHYKVATGQVGSDLLGRAALDRFGISVDLSDDGTKVAIGAPNNDDRWQDGGQVHIFDLVTDNEGIVDWEDPLKTLKVLGDDEGHEFGSAMSMNGRGDTIVSSSVVATNDEGTVGGGDPRVMYIAHVDGTAEELGYGFPEIGGYR